MEGCSSHANVKRQDYVIGRCLSGLAIRESLTPTEAIPNTSSQSLQDISTYMRGLHNIISCIRVFFEENYMTFDVILIIVA